MVGRTPPPWRALSARGELALSESAVTWRTALKSRDVLSGGGVCVFLLYNLVHTVSFTLLERGKEI